MVLLLQICFCFVLRDISRIPFHGKLRLILLKLSILRPDTKMGYPAELKLIKANSSDSFWIKLYPYLSV